jgi:sugar/nucleoside kinase (ribokinase family)
MAEHPSKVVVVGSVAVDHVITPFSERPQSVGGAATYFSMAASYLAPVQLVGIIGGDFPDAAISDLKAKNVDLEGLEVVPEGKTFFWKGSYHANMKERDTLDTQLGVFEGFDPKLPEAYRDSEMLFLANIVPALQLQVLDQIRKPKLVGLDTMNLWIDTAVDDLKRVISKVDVLMINDEEAMQLSGEHNLVKAARAIRALGPTSLVIKRGEHGALLFHEDDIFAAPALPLEEVIDPTGAGDSFAGGFMGYLARGVQLHGENLRAAMICGSVLASYCVEGFSYDRIKNLDLAQIQARYDAFSKLTDFAKADLL